MGRSLEQRSLRDSVEEADQPLITKVGDPRRKLEAGEASLNATFDELTRPHSIEEQHWKKAHIDSSSTMRTLDGSRNFDVLVQTRKVTKMERDRGPQEPGYIELDNMRINNADLGILRETIKVGDMVTVESFSGDRGGVNGLHPMDLKLGKKAVNVTENYYRRRYENETTEESKQSMPYEEWREQHYDQAY